MTSIPFSIENAYKGFAKVGGILYISNKALTLEFETKDSMIGFFKSGVKKISLSAGDLESLILEKKFFKRNLIIRTRSLFAIRDFPHSENGQIRLQIDKSYLKLAESMVSSMNLAISEERLSRLDREMDDDSFSL